MNALIQSGARLEECSTVASIDDVVQVHDRAFLDALRRHSDSGGGWVNLDTFLGPDSLDVALESAGCCIAAAESAVNGSRSFALVRPPGHHAGPKYAMGFCLLNGVAIAARSVLQSGMSRVAIVDFDVHHGNGTEDIFWDDPRVLYCSIHQSPWYPGTGHLTDTGSSGNIVNTPLRAGAAGDTYLAAIGGVLAPILEKFAPDVMLLSAGFDAHIDDPLGGMRLTAKDFGSIGGHLASIADEVYSGRLALVLEGGYHRKALADSVLATLSALESDRDVEADRQTPDLDNHPLELSEALMFHLRNWDLLEA